MFHITHCMVSNNEHGNNLVILDVIKRKMTRCKNTDEKSIFTWKSKLEIITVVTYCFLLPLFSDDTAYKMIKFTAIYKLPQKP